MRLSITLAGDAKTMAALAAKPVALAAGMYRATEAAVKVMERKVRSDTPVLTGALAGSITTQVQQRGTGAVGYVYSNLRYARFVEVGTKRGRPRKRPRPGKSDTIIGRRTKGARMFRTGLKESKPVVVELYNVVVREILSSA
jgi:phage gpG-like protein